MYSFFGYAIIAIFTATPFIVHGIQSWRGDFGYKLKKQA